MRDHPDDTIAAVSTPIGEGGIGIVRLSGKRSLFIADKIFRSKDGTSPSLFKSYTTHYGHIVELKDDGGGGPALRVDEVILTVMRCPRSYTKEDIVEINCHGGIVPLKKVLELVLSLGARLAQPGEFTKRAFLNGRIDLTQAESVLDVIRSKTDTSLRAAINQLKGGLSEEIKGIREELADLMGYIEASIDFPDEEIEILPKDDFRPKIKEAIDRISHLIDSADRGKILREGIRTVICGRPNVGKSSLMNLLLREKRVIVSHIPGTTRDIIEEIINIDGIPLKIVDTAGIIETADFLTKEGIERTRRNIRGADLVLFILDAGEPLGGDDRVIMQELRGKKVIVVVNKTDLPRKLEIDEVKRLFQGKEVVEISAAKEENLRTLENAISAMVWSGDITSDHTDLAANARHKILLVQTRAALEGALNGIDKGLSAEFIALDMKRSIDGLGEIIGETVDPDLLDKIFSMFCIGK